MPQGGGFTSCRAKEGAAMEGIQQRGFRSSESQRRINARNSCAALSAAIENRFPDGFWMVTLEYQKRPGRAGPKNQIAKGDLENCLRAAREQGGSLQYIRISEPERPGGYGEIHRILVEEENDAAGVSRLWRFGPARIERVEGTNAKRIAAFIMRSFSASEHRFEPGRRMWVQSRGPGRTKD